MSRRSKYQKGRETTDGKVQELINKALDLHIQEIDEGISKRDELEVIAKNMSVLDPIKGRKLWEVIGK